MDQLCIPKVSLSLLQGMAALSGETNLSKLILSPSEKGSNLNGKNLLPFRVEPFQKGLKVSKEASRKLQKLSPLSNGGKSTKCIHSP